MIVDIQNLGQKHTTGIYGKEEERKKHRNKKINLFPFEKRLVI